MPKLKLHYLTQKCDPKLSLPWHGIVVSLDWHGAQGPDQRSEQNETRGNPNGSQKLETTDEVES